MCHITRPRNIIVIRYNVRVVSYTIYSAHDHHAITSRDERLIPAETSIARCYGSRGYVTRITRGVPPVSAGVCFVRVEHFFFFFCISITRDTVYIENNTSDVIARVKGSPRTAWQRVIILRYLDFLSGECTIAFTSRDRRRHPDHIKASYSNEQLLS